MKHQLTVFILVLFCLMALGSTAWLNHNDNVANAEVIDISALDPETGTFTVNGDNVSSTLESGEPTAPCLSSGDVDNGKSVWYTFTTPDENFRRCLSLDTFDFDNPDANFNTNLVVYKKNGAVPPFSNLEVVACNDDYPGDPDGVSVLDFKTDPNSTYCIRVSGTVSSTTRANKVSVGEGFFELNGFFFGVLPVELTSFTALVNANTVELSWITASETNNVGFEIQHRIVSSKGHDLDQPWQVLAFVEGAGTTAVEQNYRYRINHLEPGLHRFRLKQIDLDGGFELSEVVEVSIDVPTAYHLSSAYPNPFNPSTNFTLTVAESQQVTLEVYDIVGRHVQTLYAGHLASDIAHAFRFDASDLPSGQYLIRARGDAFDTTLRVMFLK